MRKQVLLGLAAVAVVLVTAGITFGVATRNAPERRPPSAAAPPSLDTPPAEGPAEQRPEPVTLDPNDPTAKWPERYRGRPIILVLEAYVLDTLGELPPRMQELVPELVQRAFGGSGGDWKATVRQQLRWKPEMDQAILDDWKRYQAKAEKEGQVANSLDFAQQFADLANKMMREGPDDAGR
jgi:hypothetical protein